MPQPHPALASPPPARRSTGAASRRPWPRSTCAAPVRAAAAPPGRVLSGAVPAAARVRPGRVLRGPARGRAGAGCGASRGAERGQDALDRGPAVLDR